MKYDKTHGSSIPKVHLTTPMTPDCLFEINKRFMGGGMSQNYAAIYFLEYYIQTYEFDYIVEIGSQKGALSLYLANVAAVTESFYFETYEIDKKSYWYNRKEEGAGHWFEKIETISRQVNSYETNIFNPTTIEHIKVNIDRHDKVLIFCDGGDKPKEFATFAPLLKKDDHIAVHDWDREIRYDQIKDVMQAQNVAVNKIFAPYSLQLRTLIMPFVKQ